MTDHRSDVRCADLAISVEALGTVEGVVSLRRSSSMSPTIVMTEKMLRFAMASAPTSLPLPETDSKELN